MQCTDVGGAQHIEDSVKVDLSLLLDEYDGSSDKDGVLNQSSMPTQKKIYKNIVGTHLVHFLMLSLNFGLRHRWMNVQSNYLTCNARAWLASFPIIQSSTAHVRRSNAINGYMCTMRVL